VNSQAGQAHEEIGFGISGPSTGHFPEAILEALCLCVHLHGANGHADLDVVLAANHLERIADGENIGPTLEGREAAITNREVVAENFRDGQPATDAGRSASVAGRTVEIRAGNAELSGSAGSRSFGSDVVEDAIVATADLIDGIRGKDVRLAQGDVAAVIDDALVAGEEEGLGQIADAAAARDVGSGLIIAEARERGIRGGEGVIESDVEPGFVQRANRLVEEVEVASGVIGVCMGIEGDELLADVVEEACGDLVAGYADCLAAIARGIGGSGTIERQRIAKSVALKIGAVGTAGHIGIEDRADGARRSEGIVGKIASAHGIGGDKTGKDDAVALILLFSIDEEEGFVLANGAADGAAELIQIELFGGGGEEAFGVERGVAEEFKERAMEIVVAGFCGDKNGWSRARAVFSGIVVSENFEFLDGIDRGKNSDTAGSQFVVVVAVEEPVGAVGAGAADGKREGAARGDFAAGGAVEKAVVVSFLRGARRERGELDEVAAIERKLGHFLGGDDLAKGRISGLDRDGRARDFHC